MFEKDFHFFPYELLFQARSERQLLFLNIFGYGSKSDFPFFALTSFSIVFIRSLPLFYICPVGSVANIDALYLIAGQPVGRVLFVYDDSNTIGCDYGCSKT